MDFLDLIKTNEWRRAQCNYNIACSKFRMSNMNKKEHAENEMKECKKVLDDLYFKNVN